MYQQITIVGNVGQDPEMRYTADGTPVTSFSVAVNKTWKDPQGNQQSKVTWFRVTTWRNLAESCHRYLSKGRAVLITGEMNEPRPWQSRDGEWRANLELTAIMVKFLGRKDDTGGEHTEYTHSETPDEEIPF